jgi:hypothetical protein
VRLLVRTRASLEEVTATAGKTIEVKLVADRVTKGAVRFTEATDDHPLSVYLRKEQATALGVEIAEGAEIKLAISAA